MDVTCNRCGTVYEFEEGLISTTGTTVKCTQCGHLFKVHRPSPLPPAGGLSDIAIEASRWRVRRVDGSTHTLDSLAELSSLIGAGQFGADDEISRTGHIWKRLGEIAELSSLFERPARPRRMSEPPPQPQIPLAAAIEDAKRITASERPSGAPSDAPRRRVPTDPRFHVMGAEVEIDSPRSSAAPPAPETAEEPVSDDALATAPHQPQPATPPSAPSSGAPPAAAPAAQSVPAPVTAPAPAPVAASPAASRAAVDAALDDAMIDDIRRSDRGARTVMVVCGLLLAVGVGAAVLVQSRATTTTTDSARVLLERADAALAEHDPDAFQRALGLYTQALALHPEDAHTLASISRAYAIWSQWLREDLSDKPADPAAALADNVARAEAQRLAEQAKQYAARATRHASGLVEANVAYGDALRLNDDLAGARSEVERARGSESAPSAETLRVAALVAIDSAGGVADAGRKLAEQAVALEPNLIRTRFLLARCLIDDKDADGAQQQLDALRSLNASHPRLPRLAQEIEALRAASQPVARKGQAGGTAATPAAQPSQPAQPQQPAQPPPPPVAAKPAVTTKPPVATSSDEHAGDTNDPLELVRRGEKAQERGAVQAARSAFERALEIEPQLWRAKTGLGYLALERNQPNAAIAYFRPAALHGHAEAFIGMGDAYRRIGRKREALDAYDTYLKRFPDGPQRSIAQHQSELLSEQLDNH